MKFPKKMWVRREEDYHTHYVGKYENGFQFLGYALKIWPNPHKDEADGSLLIKNMQSYFYLPQMERIWKLNIGMQKQKWNKEIRKISLIRLKNLSLS